MKDKIIGYNFLHTHPNLEKSLNLDENHVIVDKEDLMKIIDFYTINVKQGFLKNNKSGCGDSCKDIF